LKDQVKGFPTILEDVCKIIESGSTLSALSEVYRILEAGEEPACRKVWFYLCLIGDEDLRMKLAKSLADLAGMLRTAIQDLQAESQENKASASLAKSSRSKPIQFGIKEQ
jgi:hypothetical protein